MTLAGFLSQVWLDAKEDRGVDADANEMFFPPTQQVADLTDVCREALLSGLPVAPRCASTTCLSGILKQSAESKNSLGLVDLPKMVTKIDMRPFAILETIVTFSYRKGM